MLDRLPRGGLCAGVSTRIFFPDDDETPDPRALALCARCPIREDCLEWALTHDEVGIWGGLTDPQRVAINRRRHRVRCPGCTSDSVMSDGHTEICLACGLSWKI